MPLAKDLCTKCGIKEREPLQRWCPECQALYMREYRRTSKKRQIIQCRNDGAALLRIELIGVFQKIGLSGLNGVTAAEIIRTTKFDCFTASRETV